ncbi:MAG TPA: tyrosine-type recombinase/integrase [Terriglobales bacterium]|nr:tyrosine-type recombinase/integrase [Terriglobales bacterium]
MRPTGHIRERSPESWELRYSLGTDPATGKRRTATATVKGDRRAAEKELRRLLRTLDTGEHVDPTRITLREWLTTWLAAVREEVSPKTHERYSEIVQNFLVLELGALPITKLSAAHIQAAYTKWATEGRRDGKKGGLSPRTRRHIHRIFNCALARAVEQQVLARNPGDAFRKRLPKVERREMVTLSPEQSARLLEAIRHTRFYWPVLLALSTGMRRGETLALRWKNVDLERGTLRVVESLEQTKSGIRFKAPKTDRVRVITLPGFATEALRRHKREQAEELLMLGIRQSGENLVCGRADGLPLQPQTLTHNFIRLVGRLRDLPRVRFHDLRHSHATQLLLDGVHPKIAQERLGHASITTTLDLYSHVTDTMQNDAAARLDVAFRTAITHVAGTK